MFDSNDELWAFVERLAAELDSQPNSEAKKAAERIKQAMRISSVGTEVSMATRHSLNELLNSNIQLTNELRTEIGLAIKAFSTGLSR